MAIWKAKTKEGKEISELDSSWGSINRDDISELLMISNNNQVIMLPKNMDSYIQFKTGSADIGSNNIQIESRTIGYKLGNNTVKLRVDEKNNNITVEVN